jgi:hypothetical protein
MVKLASDVGRVHGIQDRGTVRRPPALGAEQPNDAIALSVSRDGGRRAGIGESNGSVRYRECGKAAAIEPEVLEDVVAP